MPCHAIPCHAMPCHAMPCHAMPPLQFVLFHLPAKHCPARPCLASVGMDESLDLYGGAMRLGRHMQLHVEGQKPAEPFFYDTWGYRHDGQRFASVPPYSPCYRPDEPFRLDTVGSVALIDARYLQLGARMEHEGFVNLCGRVREQGGEIWCDPRITINQPLELWTFQDN